MKIHYLVFIFLKKFSLEKGSSFQLLAVGLEPGTTRLKEGKIRTSPLTVFLNISCENFAMWRERICMDFPLVWLGGGFVGCHWQRVQELKVTLMATAGACSYLSLKLVWESEVPAHQLLEYAGYSNSYNCAPTEQIKDLDSHPALEKLSVYHHRKWSFIVIFHGQRYFLRVIIFYENFY